MNYTQFWQQRKIQEQLKIESANNRRHEVQIDLLRRYANAQAQYIEELQHYIDRMEKK